MMDSYRTRGNVGLLLGLILQILGCTLVLQSPWGTFGRVLGITLLAIGAIALMWGAWNYGHTDKDVTTTTKDIGP